MLLFQRTLCLLAEKYPHFFQVRDGFFYYGDHRWSLDDEFGLDDIKLVLDCIDYEYMVCRRLMQDADEADPSYKFTDSFWHAYIWKLNSADAIYVGPFGSPEVGARGALVHAMRIEHGLFRLME